MTRSAYRNAVLATGVLVTFVACAPIGEARAPSFVELHHDITEVLDRVPIPGLSVAVVRDDSVLWSRGYGVADGATGRAVTARTPYRIASIAKPMTATVILRLAERGELDLDAPVRRYLDDPPAWADATVRQLLTHTSEGPDPGSSYTYSGRYNVLSAVAEGAAGRPFPELLESLVFEAAGMTSTVAVDRLGTSWLADSLARPHGPTGRPADPALPDRASGGNGVVSTVLDLARFVDAFADGRLVPPEARVAAWTPAGSPSGPLPYGMGWFVDLTPVGPVVWHGGQWPVYSGLLLHVRDRGLTLAVLANSWHVSHPYYAIGTGTVLYNAIVASFFRNVVLAADRDVPGMPWGADADSLARIGARLPPPLGLFWGAEMFGRGLLHREGGRPARADSLLAGAVACCQEALLASEDLGVLFHLGRSDDPRLREIGQRAGEDRLARLPGDALTRFHLAVSYVRSGDADRAGRLLDGLRTDDGAPSWIRGWSAYLRAEQLAATDPERAARLLRGVLEAGVDESGLLEDARTLLNRLDR